MCTSTHISIIPKTSFTQSSKTQIHYPINIKKYTQDNNKQSQNNLNRTKKKSNSRESGFSISQ